MNKNTKGFTLIELSIVLIIIGLLVAGITGGASLIKSAELRSVMSEIRNYQTALNAYYTATGDLPGTSSSSQMTFAGSCGAWAALVTEGIVDTRLESFTSGSGVYTCSDIAADGTFSTDNSVTAKMKGSIYALGFNNGMNQNVIFMTATGETPDKLENAYAGNGSGAVAVEKASIARKDAKFLDEKMDNGTKDSGRLQTFKAGADSACDYGTTGNDASKKDCAIAVSFGL